MCVFIQAKDKNSIEREINGNGLTEPREAAEAFAAYCKGVFNSHYMRDISTTFSHLIP
jgi:hypothetical protein